MPNVRGKEFPYTDEGMRQAEEYAAEKGGQSTSGFMMKGWSAFTKPKSKKKKYNGI